MKNVWKFKCKRILCILTCLLLTVTFACANSFSVRAAEQLVFLALNRQSPEENVAFQMTNMFPGDSVTQYYRLSVSYTGTITVNFQTVAGSGDEKLKEVLEVKVRLVNTGELLYEGMLADMPVLGYELSTDSESLTEELTYKITVGLSTSVGNEYQNQSLTADLSWWAEGKPGGGDDPTEPSEPEGGDDPTEPGQSEGGDVSAESTDSEGGSLTNPPGTSDDSKILMWVLILCVAMAAMLLVAVGYRKNRQITMAAGVSGEYQRVAVHSHRRFLLGIVLVILLILGLGITSFALIWQKVTVEENLFVTGTVSISLNDDQPVFQEDILFEPGMVIKKDFTLRNDSTCDVHYRLYFTNVDGKFARALQVEVLDGEAALFEGTLADMNGEKSEGADGVLRKGEDRVMTIVFRVPEDCGNGMQGQTILFDLNADAVQAVNNPDGLFE